MISQSPYLQHTYSRLVDPPPFPPHFLPTKTKQTHETAEHHHENSLPKAFEVVAPQGLHGLAKQTKNPALPFLGNQIRILILLIIYKYIYIYVVYIYTIQMFALL